MARKITFTQAVVEFNYEMEALRRAAGTVREYNTTYEHFLRLMDDLPLNDYNRHHIIVFLNQIGKEPFYPGGSKNVEPRLRSKKTLKNYYTGLAALWTWAIDQKYVDEHIVRTVTPPKPETKVIVPYTDKEIVDMVEACSLTARWHNKPMTRSERITAHRDKAILLILVDSGLRNEELRELKMEDVDIRNNTIHVRDGKGDIERHVSFGILARRALVQWFSRRPKEAEWFGDHVFTSVLNYKGQQIQSNTLTKLIKRIAKRAEVKKATVHRFRHTAAIRRLQNGMNAFQLMKFMGHASIETTKIYVNLAGLDMEEVLKSTNPADRLRIRK